jgi:hypothetical protein
LGITTAQPVLGNPAINLNRNLTAFGITASPILGKPVLTENATLGYIKINGAWTEIDTASVCIDHEWKAVKQLRIAVSGTWK